MMLSHFLAGALLAGQGGTYGNPDLEHLNPKRDCVVTENATFVLMPPKMVSGGNVVSLQWSSDGRYLLTIREQGKLDIPDLLWDDTVKRPPRDSEGEQSLWIWDSTTGKNREIISPDNTSGKIVTTRWLAGKNIALVVVDQHLSSSPQRKEPVEHYSVVRIDPDGGTSTIDEEYLRPGEEVLDLLPSPVLPFAFLLLQEGRGEAPDFVPPKFYYKLINNSGNQVLPLAIRDSGMIFFDQAGKSLYLGPSTPGKQRASRQLFEIDEATGSLRTSDKKFNRASMFQYPTLPLAIQTVNESLSNQTSGSVDIGVLWLTGTKGSEQPRAFVSAQVGLSELSLKIDRVAYTSQGSLFVREIRQLGVSDYKQAVALYNRNELLARGHFIGVALQLSSADHDGKYPSQKQMADVSPYVRDASVMTGFRYTYGGSDKSPDAVVGYLETAGGRVIVFLNGQTKWQPNQ